MKLTTAMMAVAVLVGSAAAQNTNVIDNTRNTLNQVQQKQTSASNAALAAAQGQPAPAAKPSAAVPAKNAPQPAPNTAPGTAKSATPAPAKSAAAGPAAKPAVANSTTTPAKANVAAANASSKSGANSDAKKPAKAEKVTPVNVIVPKIPQEKPTMTKKAMAAAAAAEAKPVETKEAKAGDKAEDKEKDKPKEYSSLGKRDPFLSPVVAHVGGSGCSTGKKCLDIAQINLRGVVKSDSGMIAVVTNSLNKAYFLRENDPVFNGYVIKITGDSIVFKESYQDQLGKPMTRDVTKKITTPAV
jgi:Tfp pilus assembly protein PilP